MSNESTVNINTGDEGSKGPSLEDSYKALVEEGLISDDGDTASTEQAADETEEGSNEERPSWLPAKYKTVEAFLKSHEELERKLGAPKAKETEETPAVTDDNKPTAEERKAAEEATKKAGLDLGKVSSEFQTNGELSADTYTKLENAGYPREMVDIYVEGLTNRLQATEQAAYAAVGGADAYGEMIDWAAQNLPQDEQDAFDAAVNSNKKATALMAIRGLKAQMDAAVKAEASEEPEVQINKGGKSSDGTYETIDDYLADLNDPRYDKNESFRRKVMAKLDRSKIM